MLTVNRRLSCLVKFAADDILCIFSHETGFDIFPVETIA